MTTSNTQLDQVIEKLVSTPTANQHKQIVDAIKASLSLTNRLTTLATTNKLSEIRVIPSNAAASLPKPGPFNGWVDATTMFLTDDLVTELSRSRALDYDQVHEHDIYPNNCTFVLAHLAFHIESSWDTFQMLKSLSRQEYVIRMVEHAASAFICGWNDMVDAAISSNAGKPLTPHQISTLLLNLRYRSYFLKAWRQPDNMLQISEVGNIEMNRGNVQAMTLALQSSTVADIQ